MTDMEPEVGSATGGGDITKARQNYSLYWPIFRTYRTMNGGLSRSRGAVESWLSS
jgi:hypothetical protein